MKNQDEMMAYFRNMPKKEKKNPYWAFDEEQKCIKPAGSWEIPYGMFSLQEGEPLLEKAMQANRPLLGTVRSHFRMVYDSFGTEAQVLCVTEEDASKLKKMAIPFIQTGERQHFCGIFVEIFVLPQFNTPVNSVISEHLWQKAIVSSGITPVVRIHSHHMLDAYQSATDHSTLNSNTLEMVMGHIGKERLQVAYWLDEHGKDTKDAVFRALEGPDGQYSTMRIPCGKPKHASMAP